MENVSNDSDIDHQIAQRLKALRNEQGWSLDELAKRSQVSRATLSRLENTEVSATASVLGRLCAAYGIPMSRLMRMVEEQFEPVIRHDAQPLWVDAETGFRRRSISPPSQTLAGEVLECELPAGTRLAYDQPSRKGMEHHLLMIAGTLDFTIDGRELRLGPGDCLRYQLFGATTFEAGPDASARYFLFMV
ncbi:helix-turn-helix transcriptional regulator [Rhizobium sp. KVB221]|uniref:Helix-turn-helix transcriptional regulator n=1 Tax=Rhizobium setariae TaxID=2801340 RepID=A0A936YL84_9HYPH|nr:XRE family transcriptional regulator [Rhizobium setariae]MBL0371613.1 helix-turn-helix transcriptional regulator [Rhizobium setariae]